MPCCAVLPADNAAGTLVLGRSDLDFTIRGQPRAGLVLMNLRGRIVPPTGGREYPVDCNLAFNVSHLVTVAMTCHVIQLAWLGLHDAAAAAAEKVGCGAWKV